MDEWWIGRLAILPLFSQVVNSRNNRRYLTLVRFWSLYLTSLYFFMNVLFEQPHIFFTFFFRVFYLLIFLFQSFIIYCVKIIRIWWINSYSSGSFILSFSLRSWYKLLYLHSFILINFRSVFFFNIHTVCALFLNK